MEWYYCNNTASNEIKIENIVDIESWITAELLKPRKSIILVSKNKPKMAYSQDLPKMARLLLSCYRVALWECILVRGVSVLWTRELMNQFLKNHQLNKAEMGITDESISDWISGF